ncbi:MAG: membrane-bound lytic murein transglycosylase MltF [gamma proteobacterium endosymbiont of Lamellibrachia anaximandri]|nr:membrane-bound lytic murein transglycosylase MltF [gamma proteobacterium endosymbiont of Lamellibrachia anaximandri]MBL3619348.1 membrane-bound lytic murein transglycosylase MltF [gamma proteobacterium endosymbiont of Lamellibrachia anaximandri]
MRLSLYVISLLLLASCSIPPPLIDQIKAGGELVIATRNSGTTYYEGSDGLTGLEYDLVQQFAREIGVKARFVIPKGFEELLPMVTRGEAHLAAAGLTITQARETRLRFGPSYQEITQQVVYRGGKQRPRKVEDLIGKSIEVLPGSSHEEELRRLLKEYPELSWSSPSDLESGDLLQRVQDEKIDYTIADSNEIAVNRRFMQNIRVAFDLTKPQQLAWAMAHTEDSSLFDVMQNFFDRIRKDGTLAQLIERHYGHVDRLNFVESRTFLRHTDKRLPKYEALFKTAAEEIGIDWQMLAAIGYQESHWNPKAKSPTGVRGIMMLTRNTAKQVKVTDRLDPEQSITGGARYLEIIEKKIPKRIEEPDRFWMTLAGYNVGFGHLEDARIITQRQGANPDKWADVKKHLPLLSRKKWYSTVKHGYARGQEPVNYVDNIRAYYELLKWKQLQMAPPSGKPELPYALSISPDAL